MCRPRPIRLNDPHDLTRATPIKNPAGANQRGFFILGFFYSKALDGERVERRPERSEASLDVAGGIAAGRARGAETDPCARARIVGAYDCGCAVRRLLTRNVDIGCHVGRERVLRNGLLLWFIG